MTTAQLTLELTKATTPDEGQEGDPIALVLAALLFSPRARARLSFIELFVL